MNGVTPNLLRRLQIGPEHWDVPVHVAWKPYLEFTRSINRQLRELVDRYTPADRPPAPLPNWVMRRRPKPR